MKGAIQRGEAQAWLLLIIAPQVLTLYKCSLTEDTGFPAFFAACRPAKLELKSCALDDAARAGVVATGGGCLTELLVRVNPDNEDDVADEAADELQEMVCGLAALTHLRVCAIIAGVPQRVEAILLHCRRLRSLEFALGRRHAWSAPWPNDLRTAVLVAPALRSFECTSDDDSDQQGPPLDWTLWRKLRARGVRLRGWDLDTVRACRTRHCLCALRARLSARR